MQHFEQTVSLTHQCALFLTLYHHCAHSFFNSYFALLRALFRSIGGGKFELLYKEFLPVLPELLQGLMRMQARG
jgi:hypothetical protein